MAMRVGLIVFMLSSIALAEPAGAEFDVVVYGGTSGAVAAAAQAARLGKRVVLISPDKHLGGMSSGGLGATDIGNKAAIGGIAREFYQRIGLVYHPEFKTAAEATAQWTFEPHVAEQVFEAILAEAKVPVERGERLELDTGVKKSGTRIVSITMESGRVFAGKVFIDATYEGDLMARTGVDYMVGREANEKYGETLNGVQTKHALKHQFTRPVDPYIKPGDASSGLLPGVHGESPGVEGDADQRIQAYNFRMCLTDAPENRIPFTKPEGYDPLRYELLLRYYDAGFGEPANNFKLMPNHKTDCNNDGAFSTDAIGMNYKYPNGDYATRDRIIKEHEAYQRGLMWTMASSPRVPEKIRREYAEKWGLSKDEFADSGHWPRQLYVREARRMDGELVMTERHCRGTEVAADPIGLAAYTMDSHNVQRHIGPDGKVRNEGDVQVGGFPPYPISYRAITPDRKQCTNLLVPVCLSASHIAYGSIRMEPVFMVLGHSAAAAASLAIDAQCDVQAISYPKLRQQLTDQHQMLTWDARKPPKKSGGR